MVWTYVIVSLIAYFIGSVSFSVIFSRKFAGFDVREKGSKNAGTTNVLRTAGKKAAILTLICDILKGVLAIVVAIIAEKIVKQNLISLEYLAGFFVILGHTFPIFFEFRGGKGVATALGVLAILDWKIALICLIFAIIIIATTKFVSAGSVLSAILFPILAIFMETDKNFWTILISILISLLIIYNHRENLKRIKQGKEDKLKF
jgi:glycerol-3-phosphate acyltransferase PlsY